MPFETVQLSTAGGATLQHQIFVVLRDRILTGVYRSGDALASEERLRHVFSVSAVTIRAALALLESSGLIERRQGIGTFVTEHIDREEMNAPVADLFAHINEIERNTKVKLLRLEFVKAPYVVQTLFGCKEDEVFQRAVRLRTKKKIPLFHVVTYVPEKIAKQFTRKQMSGPSLYELLRTKGYRVKSGKQIITASAADPTVASALGVEVASPLLQIRRIHFDDRNRPFQYMEILAPPARFQVEMMLREGDLNG